MSVLDKTLLTTVGAAKYAYNDANTLPTEFAEIALGDNNGAAFIPSITDGDCVNEVYRANINSITIDPADSTIVILQLVLPAAVGGFTVREARVYDADGVVMYTANPYFIKSIDSSDQNLLFRIKRSATSNVTLLVDPSITLASHTYVINALEPYATKVGVQNCSYNYVDSTSGVSTTAYTATYTPAITAFSDGMELSIDIGNYTNTTTTPTFSPNGLTAHTIVNQGNIEVSIGDLPKVPKLRYDSTITKWVLQNPVFGLNGKLLLSTLSYPTIANATNSLTVTPAIVAGQGGNVSIAAGTLIELGRTIDSNYGVMRQAVTAAFTSPTLAVSSTYYLRAQFIGDVFTVYVQKGTDSDATPSGLVGTVNGSSGGGFDSTRLDILLAKVVTGTAGTTPTVTALKNKKVLWANGSKTDGPSASYTSTLNIALNWGRTPNAWNVDTSDFTISGGVGNAIQVGTNRASGVTLSRYTSTFTANYAYSSTGSSVLRANCEAK